MFDSSLRTLGVTPPQPGSGRLEALLFVRAMCLRTFVVFAASYAIILLVDRSSLVVAIGVGVLVLSLLNFGAMEWKIRRLRRT